MSIIYLTLLCGVALLMLAALLEAVLSVSKKPVWQLQRLSAFEVPQAGGGHEMARDTRLSASGAPASSLGLEGISEIAPEVAADSMPPAGTQPVLTRPARSQPPAALETV